jgi:hypothetical protein
LLFLLELFPQSDAAECVANLAADTREHPAVILREDILRATPDQIEKPGP